MHRSFTCHRVGGNQWRARSAWAVLGATLVVAVAPACTTTEKKASSDKASTSTSAVPTTEAGTKATGTPARIGFTNAGTGATALPQITEGAQLAADRINAHENGINGHPIDLVTCSTDGTPESSAACANKLVAEKVVAVVDGADLGTDAKVPILKDAGIATMGTSTLGTTQSLSQDAFFFSPPATTYPAAEVDLAATIGAKKLTLLLPDVPQVPILAGIADKQAALNNIEVKVVKFDQAAPDFDAALAAIVADGSDAIATIATDDWCNGMVRSAKSASFTGSLILGGCTQFVAVMGAKEAEGIYTLGSIWSPSSKNYAPAAAVTVIDQYTAAMDAAGKGKDVVSLTWGGYAGVAQVAGVLRTITGELTAPTVMAAMRSLKDAPNAIGQTITCDPRPYPGFSGCTEGWLQFRTQADGTSKPLTNEFVKPKS